jgi:ferredoxin
MISNKAIKPIIFYFSPNGSTKKIIKKFEYDFLDLDIKPKAINLTGKTWNKIINYNYHQLDSFNLLIIAFPVYAWKIAEPMEKFILNLPSVENKFALILATYGGVTPGRSLIDAAKILKNKGYKIIGAAKIVAPHSTIFEKDKDPFSQRPNEGDMDKFHDLIKSILVKIKLNHDQSINIKNLNSNSKLIRILSASPIAKKFSRSFPPSLKFNHKKCTKCGLCATCCPMKIIKLNPYPILVGKCLRCHNCKRICPSNAIQTTGLWRKYLFHIGLQKLLITTGGEKPWTQIFI